MNTELTTLEWTLIVSLWICLGVTLDIIKKILSTVGIFSGKTTEMLRGVSRTGRVQILKIDGAKIDIKVIKTISQVFGYIKCSMWSWSNNFLKEVVDLSHVKEVALDISSSQRENKQRSDENETYLVSCENNAMSIFVSQPKEVHAGQQIVGALLGFLALLMFVYSDMAQGAQTFTLLFPGPIPDFLNSIVIPLMTASVGSALILGVFIGDMLGLTHFGLFEKENTPKLILWIVCVNLILSLVLSTTIALARMQLLGTNIPIVQTLVNISQSIVILPMLVTTALLFRAWTGVFVALSIVLSVLSLPFAMFEFFIRILTDLLRFGVITSSFVITRIVGLVVGSFELVFLLLELAVKGSFAVLLYIVIGIFFIPNAVFNVILALSGKKDAYSQFLQGLLNIELNTRVVYSEGEAEDKSTKEHL